MVIQKDDQFYLQKINDLMEKFESILDKLKIKAENADGKNKTNLQHHVIKIQVKKARTEAILRKIKVKSDQKAEDPGLNLDISLNALRKAISNAFIMTNNNQERKTKVKI